MSECVFNELIKKGHKTNQYKGILLACENYSFHVGKIICWYVI
jgi:hypothetical protein